MLICLVYELWFKQILHELESVMDIMRAEVREVELREMQ